MKKLLLFLIALLLTVPKTDIPVKAEKENDLYLSAESAVLMDADSKNVLYGKNINKVKGMASTTKIMTALVAVENCELDKTVKIPSSAVGVEGSSVYLKEGEQFTLKELLYALLLSSANDAAVAIAIEVGGSVENFADMMNERAKSMGLSHTHFTNPHGLTDENHCTTAYDLAVISSTALENTTVCEIASTYKKTIPFEDSQTQKRVLVNHNKMLKLYKGAIGLKTGYTEKSGRCLVSAARRNELSLVAVTLNAPDDWNDHTKLLDYGYNNYESLTVAEMGCFKYSVPLCGGVSESVTAENTDVLKLTVPKVRDEIECRIETYKRFEMAPVEKGTPIGKVVCSYKNTFFTEAPLVCTESAGIKKRSNFFDSIKLVCKTCS